MKKLLLIIVAAVLFPLIVSCATIEQSTIDVLVGEHKYQGYVKEYTITINEEEHQEYLIYIGDKNTELMDKQISIQGVRALIRLMHPVPGLEVPFDAPYRWYAELIDNRYNTYLVGGVFTDEVWRTLPLIMKHILFALDYKDEDLIMVELSLLTASIHIHFHPRYVRDKRYYNKKFRILKRYLENNDLLQDINIEPQKIA